MNTCVKIVGTWLQVVCMMPRHTSDSCMVLGCLGFGVHGKCEHLRSHLRRCERRCEAIREYQHNPSARPTTHFPHVPCTTPYAWEVLGTAPASWVLTPPFTPKHALSMAIHSSNARSRPPYGEAIELEDDRHSVGMLSTCLFLLS